MSHEKSETVEIDGKWYNIYGKDIHKNSPGKSGEVLPIRYPSFERDSYDTEKSAVQAAIRRSDMDYDLKDEFPDEDNSDKDELFLDVSAPTTPIYSEVDREDKSQSLLKQITNKLTGNSEEKETKDELFLDVSAPGSLSEEADKQISYVEDNNTEELFLDVSAPGSSDNLSEKRTGPIQEAEIGGWGANLMKAVFFVDRGRAADRGAIIELVHQIGEGEIDMKAIRKEFGEGLRGEDHTMLFEDFKAKIMDVSEHPDNYPIASKILPMINFALTLPNKAIDASIDRFKDPTNNPGLLLAAMVYPTNTEGEPSVFINKVKQMKEYKQAQRENKEPTTLAADKLALILGFIGDVAIDPVTYINPILKLVKTGANLITRYVIPDVILNQISKGTGLAKEEIFKLLTHTTTGQFLRKSGDQMFKLFSTKHGLTGQQIKWQEQFQNLISAARMKSIRENEGLQSAIKDFTVKLNKENKTKVTYEEVNSFIIEAVERGGIANVELKNLSPQTVKLLANNPKLREQVRALATKNEAQLKLELEMGVPLTQLSDQVLVNQADEGSNLLLFYFNHAITPEARKAAILRKIKDGTAPSFLKSIAAKKGDRWDKVKYWFSNEHTSALKRRKQWEGLTINDINELAKKGELPGYKGTVFKNGFFHADASVAQALRDFKHHKSIAAAKLAGEITKTGGIGVSPDDLIKLAKKLGFKHKKPNPQSALKYLKETEPDKWENFVLSENKFTQNFAVPKDVAKFVDTTLKSINDPKKVNEFLEHWDWATRWYKSWTLSIFPSYHVRNKAGNLWNNFVMGVNPRAYKDALKYQTKMSSGETGWIEGIKLKGARKKDRISYEQLQDMVEEYGVTGRGLFTADIESTLLAEMGQTKWLTLSADNRAIMIGKRVGESVENNARLANFIDGLRKGMTPAEAAKRVKKALFDYSDLTVAEQTVFKRIFPFYTWTRKNIPYQIEMMIKHPGKYKGIDTLRMEIEAAVGEEDENEKHLSSWMLANYPTKVKVEKIKDENGNTKNVARYFMLGGWWAGADLWKLGSQPIRVVTDLLHPILKVGLEETISQFNEEGYVTDMFSGKKIHQDLNTNYLGGWDNNRIRISQTKKHYLNNIRVLNTLDKAINTYYENKPEYQERWKKISGFTRKPKTLGEFYLWFLTGVQTFSIDLENNKLFALKEIQDQIKQEENLYRRATTDKAPQKELDEYTENIKRLGEKIKERFSTGGVVSQMQRLNFADGGEVFTLTKPQWKKLIAWFKTEDTPKIKDKEKYLRGLSASELESMWKSMPNIHTEAKEMSLAEAQEQDRWITLPSGEVVEMFQEYDVSIEEAPKFMEYSDLSDKQKASGKYKQTFSEEEILKAEQIAAAGEAWKEELKRMMKATGELQTKKKEAKLAAKEMMAEIQAEQKVATAKENILKERSTRTTPAWLVNAGKQIADGLRSSSFAKKQAKRKENAEKDSKVITKTEKKSEKPGWRMAKDGNYWSIDTADKHWQTEEGFKEANEIFKDKPGWVNNKSFYKKYRRKYADGDLVTPISPFDGLHKSIIAEIEALDVWNWVKNSAKEKLSEGFNELGDNPSKEEVEKMWASNQNYFSMLVPEAQERISNNYKDAYSSYFDFDIPTGDDIKVAETSAIAAVGGFLKGNNLKAASRFSPWLQLLNPSTAKAPSTEEMYGAKFGTPEYKKLTGQVDKNWADYKSSVLSSKKDNRIERKEVQARAQAQAIEDEARADVRERARAQEAAELRAQKLANKQAKEHAKAMEDRNKNTVVDDQGNKGYTGTGNQSRAPTPPPPVANPPRGGTSKNYGVDGNRVTGGR